MDIIDLQSKREEVKKAKAKQRKRKSVGDKCMYNDGHDDYFKFSVRYQFAGKNWEFDIWAKSKKEAEKRVSSIQRFPVEITQVLDIIPY